MHVRQEGYYELLDLIKSIHPDKAFLRVTEAAQVTGLNTKTIKAAIEKRINPLPAINIGTGKKNKIYLIAIPSLVRWVVERKGR